MVEITLDNWQEYFDFETARKADVVVLSVGANDLTYISEGFNISTAEGNKRREEFTKKYIEFEAPLPEYFENLLFLLQK